MVAGSGIKPLTSAVRDHTPTNYTMAVIDRLLSIEYSVSTPFPREIVLSIEYTINTLKYHRVSSSSILRVATPWCGVHRHE